MSPAFPERAASATLPPMIRPLKLRCIFREPDATYFKPRGIPLRELQCVTLTLDEAEALRLKDLEDMEQKAAAKKMAISQSTFQRILVSAHRKIADALVCGKAIKIEGGAIRRGMRRKR